MNVSELAEKQYAAIKKILAEHPTQNIVMATYTREDFEELKPDENYDVFKKCERIIIERLAAEGITDSVILEPVDSVEYYQFLADNKFKHDQKSLSYFAAVKAEKRYVEERKKENAKGAGRPPKNFGIADDNMEIYAIVHKPEDIPLGCSFYEVTENYTWEPSDFTDADGQNWITVDRLAMAFEDLCEKTGMKKSALAKRCGKNPATFSRYFSGETPVPELVWKMVESLIR